MVCMFVEPWYSWLTEVKAFTRQSHSAFPLAVSYICQSSSSMGSHTLNAGTYLIWHSPRKSTLFAITLYYAVFAYVWKTFQEWFKILYKLSIMNNQCWYLLPLGPPGWLHSYWNHLLSHVASSSLILKNYVLPNPGWSLIKRRKDLSQQWAGSSTKTCRYINGDLLFVSFWAVWSISEIWVRWVNWERSIWKSVVWPT